MTMSIAKSLMCRAGMSVCLQEHDVDELYLQTLANHPVQSRSGTFKVHWADAERRIVKTSSYQVFLIDAHSNISTFNMLATRVLLENETLPLAPNDVDIKKQGFFGDALIVCGIVKEDSITLINYDVKTFHRDMHTKTQKYPMYQYLIDTVFPTRECIEVVRRLFHLKDGDSRFHLFIRGLLHKSPQTATSSDFDILRRHLYGAYLKLQHTKEFIECIA